MTENGFKTEGERRGAQFQAMMENRFFFDWWAKQHLDIEHSYKGVSDLLNKLAADSVRTRQELLGEIQSLKDRVDQLETERTEANAAIGELQEAVAGMREWAKKIGKQVKQ